VGSTTTRLTAFPAGLNGPRAIVCEVSRTVLTTNVTSAGCLFTVLGEVARIAGVL
jgi:hypothetical protein